MFLRKIPIYLFRKARVPPDRFLCATSMNCDAYVKKNGLMSPFMRHFWNAMVKSSLCRCKFFENAQGAFFKKSWAKKKIFQKRRCA
ncbi:hypothetical protein AD943_05730 [Gluconobacter roseus]|nr:hypothetical protein AD943_05730 [Gluconobacter roseus]